MTIASRGPDYQHHSHLHRHETRASLDSTWKSTVYSRTEVYDGTVILASPSQLSTKLPNLTRDTDSVPVRAYRAGPAVLSVYTIQYRVALS